ncbi:MAG: tRNA lysidine(34) synthetase TilS [Candidatus Omnitrophica bacterium]|nr:tRNA lysidine(34) synthetase TilS [Candidatus Omnitrophota bacterium]
MFLKKAQDTIKKYNLIKKDDRIVIGVSGGPDSLALLFLLHSLRDEMQLVLHVAHLDHMLRKDSHKDAQFVKIASERLGIPVTCGKADVKKLVVNGSFEEAARNARFAFFLETAKKINAKKIALGHNLDDQAETVLMRFLRGSGLYGLAGIIPKRKIYGLEIIRPLIEIKRSGIEAYLKNKGIKPRIDITNSQDIYFRNKIRNRLLPLLEKEYNKNIKEVLANTAQSLGADYDYLDKIAQAWLKGKSTRLDIAKLVLLHQAIRRLVFRKAIAAVKGDIRRISFQHIREIEDLLQSRPVNSIVDLPKGVSVLKKQKFLVFYLRKSRTNA